MMRLRPLTLTLCLSCLPSVGLAQVSGQPGDTQVSCAAWATQQTGFDPSRPPQTATANPQVAGSGSRARGAAAGAMIGGAAAGEAGQGAAAGAVAGGVAQRSRNRRATRAQNDATAQQQQAGQAAYNQALNACISSRAAQAPQ